MDSEDRIDRIPDAALQDGELTIAIRASIGRFSARGNHEGGFASDSALLLGGLADLTDAKSLFTFRSFTSNGTNPCAGFAAAADRIDPGSGTALPA